MTTRDTEIRTIREASATGLPIFGQLASKVDAKKLVCFMPAANTRKVNRNPLQLTRLTWHEFMPKFHVLALADPAMSISTELSGAWYLHPTHDLIDELSSTVQTQMDELQIDGQDVLFYGSSLGGFGALAMASTIENATAIAEVPQINVDNWPFPRSIEAMEQYILGMSFADFRFHHKYQVDLNARFEKSGRIPNFSIITNKHDSSYKDQLSFVDTVARSNLPSSGNQKLVDNLGVVGHKPLDRATAIDLIEQWANDINE